MVQNKEGEIGKKNKRKEGGEKKDVKDRIVAMCGPTTCLQRADGGLG